MQQPPGARFAVAACLAAVVLLAAACGGESKQSVRRPTATPAEPALPAATPSAAGIAATPQAASVTPNPAQAAEALLARVTLFATDLPPGYGTGQPRFESPEATASRAPDRDAFLRDATARGRLGMAVVDFLSMPLDQGGAYLFVARIAFAAESGARAQMTAFQDGDLPAVRAALGDTGVPALPGEARLRPADGAGEQAVSAELPPARDAGLPAGRGLAFRRGRIVIILIGRNVPDLVQPAQILDSRAVAAQ